MTDESRRLKGKDYVFGDTLPEWLPAVLRRPLGDLTYNEVHAMELGLVGLVIGATWAVGYPKEATVISFLLVGTAFGLRKMPEDKPVAARVVRREPWYFTTVYVLTAVLSAYGATVIL